MASTFFDRIDELSDAVGHGTLRGKVVVDQIYAHYQHEGTEFRHPEGGQAHYLRDPLFEKSDERYKLIAERAITPEGSEIRQAVIDATEALSDDVHTFAPHEFGDLRASGHPIVTDEGAVIHDRPPNVPRLGKDELKAKDEVRRLFRFDRRRP